MYRAFNLIDYDWSKFSRAVGDSIFDRNRAAVRAPLESFLTGEIVDGTKLANHWFPTYDADVFISHSHKDEDIAMRCAGWLKSVFNLDPFIDSCVWGYAETLLKQIDDKHCWNEKTKTYIYENRNGSTSHVHMMLSAALSAMLDATECVIFIKSENSITSKESIDKTKSPWIYLELSMIRILRRVKPPRKTLLLDNVSGGMIKTAQRSYEAEYEVPLSELTTLNEHQLVQWQEAYNQKKGNGAHALDLLYGSVP